MKKEQSDGVICPGDLRDMGRGVYYIVLESSDPDNHVVLFFGASNRKGFGGYRFDGWISCDDLLVRGLD